MNMENKDNEVHNFSHLLNNTRTGNDDLRLSTAKSLLFLLCTFFICFIITALLSALIMRLVSNPVAGLRISTMLQDVILFALPALATAFITTRRPARILGLMEKPGPVAVLLTGLVLIVSVPLQEAVIYWNYNWDWLPQGIETIMRALEDNANATINLMLGNTSAANLILNILIIGVAAGFCEELLFRGAILGVMVRGGVNRHLAIWLVAIIFSALHMQIFGFVPRMLLGAFFGYLFVWSGSLWLSATAHILNNTLFVLVAWMQVRSIGQEALTQEPVVWNWWITLISAAVTAIAIAWLRASIKCRKADAGC